MSKESLEDCVAGLTCMDCIKRTYCGPAKAEMLACESFKPETHITITVDEYENLKRAAHTLANLQAAGVDNWSGYYHAFDGED